MWLKIGNGYLNLDNVAAVHFLRDDDGSLTATVETLAGQVKHYQAGEAEILRGTLDALDSGPSARDFAASPP